MKNLIPSLLLTCLLTGCATYKTMTTAPKEYVLNPVWGNSKSEVKFSASVSMKPFKEELKKLENAKYETQKDEDIEPVYFTVKTKNPLYNPKKWLKTKNPTHNPNKWIKKCTFLGCFKTKNPFYDPKKWIKTKNPAYSPNRYTEITTATATVQGYKVSVWVDGKVKLEPHSGNKFNIKVPVQAKGWITFLSEITPPIVRKPFSGKMILDLDIEVDINKNWCVYLKPNADFKWKDRLKLDLTYGLKLLQIDLTDLANPEIEKMLDDIKKDIRKSFDCNTLKQLAEKEWKTRIFEISENYYAVAKPTEIGLSQLNANNKSITIYGGIKSEIGLTSDISSLPKPVNLGELKVIPPAKPSINLSLPVEINYKKIDQELMNSFSNLNIGDSNNSISGKLLVKKVETFPSGENIGLKVKFNTKLNNKILNVKATAYFTGKLKHETVIENSDNDIQVLGRTKHYISYKLDTLSFNEFGNGKDKLLLALAYKIVKNEIENTDDIEITNEIKAIETQLIKAVGELAINLPNKSKADINNIGFDKPVVKIDKWAYLKDHLLLRLNSKVKID